MTKRSNQTGRILKGRIWKVQMTKMSNLKIQMTKGEFKKKFKLFYKVKVWLRLNWILKDQMTKRHQVEFENFKWLKPVL